MGALGRTPSWGGGSSPIARQARRSRISNNSASARQLPTTIGASLITQHEPRLPRPSRAAVRTGAHNQLAPRAERHGLQTGALLCPFLLIQTFIGKLVLEIEHVEAAHNQGL